jgi:CTP synthase
VGCQFHPEFKSRPQLAAPLFRSFIAAAIRARVDRHRRTSTATSSPASSPPTHASA